MITRTWQALAWAGLGFKVLRLLAARYSEFPVKHGNLGNINRRER